MEHLDFSGMGAIMISCALFGLGIFLLLYWIIILITVKGFKFTWENIIIILLCILPMFLFIPLLDGDYLDNETLDTMAFWYAVLSFFFAVYLLYRKFIR